jgi:DNA-binding GntR family transcriptional regulator
MAMAGRAFKDRALKEKARLRKSMPSATGLAAAGPVVVVAGGGANDAVETQAARAFRLLEAMIVDTRLAPGAVVSETVLSQRIGLGRMPVREALKRLADYGLITVLPQRGVVVSPVDAGQYLQMLETRAVLDRLLASAAARRATEAERRSFTAQADDVAAAARDGDLAAFLRLDEEFDRMVEMVSRNPYAARAAAPFHAHGRRFWYVHHAERDLNRSAEAHLRLMRACAAGDEAASATASDALIEYLRRFAGEVIHRH